MASVQVEVLVWNGKAPTAGGHEGWQAMDLEKKLGRVLAVVGVQEPAVRLVVLPPLSLGDEPAAAGGEPARILEPWCDLAEGLGVNLIPGSSLAAGEKGGLFHQAPFINHKGQVIGLCTQTHLTREEADRGWCMGEELPVIETSFGKLAILLNRDCRQPEVWRLVALAGAEVVIALTMEERPYFQARKLAGSWQNVQQNQVLGVECAYEGPWQDKDYEGGASLFAPCEMTAGSTGCLTGEERAGFLTGRLDRERLHQLRTEYPLLAQLNFTLYEKMLLPLYCRWQKELEEREN